MLLLDCLDDHLQLRQTERIAKERVENAKRIGWEEFFARVVTTELHLLRERDEIGRHGEVPCFMRPKRTRCAGARLDFIGDERDAVIERQLSKLLEEVRARV